VRVGKHNIKYKDVVEIQNHLTVGGQQENNACSLATELEENRITWV